jgi:cardiolipin synthase
MLQHFLSHPFEYTNIIVSYVLGLICAAHAILSSRTPQGATAWVLFLISFPIVSVPLFLIFGRSRFRGYNAKRKILNYKAQQQFDQLKAIEADYIPKSDEIHIINSTISCGNQPGFTKRNSIELLINGEDTFQQMLQDLEKAENYIIFQVYIFRSDEIGQKFADILIRKAKAGVRVSFLNDEIGAKLSKELLRDFTRAGVKLGPFNSSNGRGKLQINFRNHRKIIVIDGKVGYVGGHNIGREYLGRSQYFGPWRDTHVRLQGPSVIAAQLACAKDWYCSRETNIDADWKIHLPQSDSNVMVLHTGPADEKQTCLLAHIALINSAKMRVWIANAYIVPPESLLDALILASLRGVDVRVIFPVRSDALTVRLASMVYKERMLDHGIKVYSYMAGFLHQKTMVVDDLFGCVGSANLDCRSMFINFEISVVSTESTFIANMSHMFENDFNHSQELHLAEFKKLSLFKKISMRGANLLAPVL